MPDEKLALIGVEAGGKVTAALALSHATKKEVRDFYRDMADTDRDVQRVSIEEARERLVL